MTEAIIIALITGAAAVLSNALITASARKRDAIERAVLDERTDQRLQSIEHQLEALERQVREHNGLKQDIAAMRADIRNLQMGAGK